MEHLHPVTDNSADVWFILRSLIGDFHTVLYSALPVGLDRKTLQTLSGTEVYTTFKVDGTWCLLFHCVEHQKIYVVFRDLTIFYLKDSVVEHTFVVMAEATSSHFHIFDLVYSQSGLGLYTHVPFVIRYQDLLHQYHLISPSPWVILKPIYSERYDHEDSPGHWVHDGHRFPVDGLVLYVNDKCYKWKDPQHHTIDVAIDPSGGTVHDGSIVYIPYVSRKLVPLRGIRIVDTNNVIGTSTTSDVLIVECCYREEGLWEVVRTRADKRVPNNLHTVLHTIRCHSEHLTVEEVWCTLYGSEMQRLDLLVSQWIADPLMELEVRYLRCTHGMYTRARHHMDKAEYIQTTDSFYPRGVRCTTTSHTAQTQVIRKQSRGSMDIPTAFGTVRVSLKREVPAPHPQGRPMYERHKCRHRISVEHGHFWFDATEVTDSHGRHTYELELECQRGGQVSPTIGRELLQTFQFLVHRSKKIIKLR
jgi:hypothetical protein